MKSPNDEIHAETTQLDIPMYQQRKLGGKCCGGCCDYRRAVIILSLIAILFTVINLPSAVRGRDLSDITNEDLRKDLEETLDDYQPKTLALTIVALIMAFVALVGAILFNPGMLGINVVWAVIHFILTVVFGMKALNETLQILDEYDFDVDESNSGTNDLTEDDEDLVIRITKYSAIATYVLVGIFTVFWVYPSVFLIMEIRSGIMTKETYPREEYSCCCTSKRM